MNIASKRKHFYNFLTSFCCEKLLLIIQNCYFFHNFNDILRNVFFYLARTLIFSSDAGTTGEVTVKVECHKRGKYLLEVMGFHPDLCHGTDFKPLTSFLISVK